MGEILMVMSIYDKVIYYSGIVGIIVVAGLMIAFATGAVSGGASAIGKASIGLCAGIGLFIRGYRAKQQAKADAAQELMNKLSGRLNSNTTNEV